MMNIMKIGKRHRLKSSNKEYNSNAWEEDDDDAEEGQAAG